VPTYEYECSSGHRYEKREGFDAPSTQRCPRCRRTARRVLQAPPIVFKGSGFYVTDSRKGAPAAESESKVESVSSASDSSSKEKDTEAAAAG
jgi:putative FmdB family regulatory protein